MWPSLSVNLLFERKTAENAVSLIQEVLNSTVERYRKHAESQSNGKIC